MHDLIKRYHTDELTIVWKPALCIHSANCIRHSRAVFDPKRRPWIIPENDDAVNIIAAVQSCPSGALSLEYPEGGEPSPAHDAAVYTNSEVVVETIPNGPLMVYGTVRIRKADGTAEVHSKTTAFCRCGLSANKPFCDGTHAKAGWRE